MTLDTKPYRVLPAPGFKLSTQATLIPPLYNSKKDYQDLLEANIQKMSALQRLLYASNQHSLLVILQAMDTAGKDGVIRHVFSGINPQGCQVYSFKHPSATELEHDFLWRTSLCLPERGNIAIFNRSYYEEVLAVRVHPHILEAQRVPLDRIHKDQIWKERFQSIVEHEEHLTRNGTQILKIFLNISKEEQRKRLLARIDNPEKNWKFNRQDIEERKFWDTYIECYEECILGTSSSSAPWHVVPADDKRNARLIASQLIIEKLESLKMSYPKSNDSRNKELKEFRKMLEV